LKSGVRSSKASSTKRDTLTPIAVSSGGRICSLAALPIVASFRRGWLSFQAWGRLFGLVMTDHAASRRA
jgi:hypothetical protein